MDFLDSTERVKLKYAELAVVVETLGIKEQLKEALLGFLVIYIHIILVEVI